MEKNEKRVRHWILQMCYLNDQYVGLSEQELFQKQHRDLEIGYGLLNKKLRELVDEKLVTPENKPWWGVHFYKLTEKGKKELNKLRSSPSENFKILSWLPPEYELRYRLRNIENFLFHSFFTFLFLLIGGISFHYHHIWLGLISVLLTYIFLPFSMLYFVAIIIFVLNQIITFFFGKTYSFMERYTKGISNFIVVFLVVTALGLIANYSLSKAGAAFGGIIIGLVFKESQKTLKFTRDKIQLGISRLKEIFKTD